MIAMRAWDVISAEVEEDFMTCRNGCNNDGVSKVRISMTWSEELQKSARMIVTDLYNLLNHSVNG